MNLVSLFSQIMLEIPQKGLTIQPGDQVVSNDFHNEYLLETNDLSPQNEIDMVWMIDTKHGIYMTKYKPFLQWIL